MQAPAILLGMIHNHGFDGQFFGDDYLAFCNQRGRDFMQMIRALVADLFMDVGNFFFQLVASIGAFDLLVQFVLCSLELFDSLFEEFRIFDLSDGAIAINGG